MDFLTLLETWGGQDEGSGDPLFSAKNTAATLKQSLSLWPSIQKSYFANDLHSLQKPFPGRPSC